MRKAAFATILGSLLACMPATPAMAAGFVNDGAAWKALPPDGRAAYVTALHDGINYIFTDDALATAIVKLARHRCVVERKINAAVLADLITTFYAQDAKRISLPPAAAYIIRLNDYCRDTINTERARFSLPPI